MNDAQKYLAQANRQIAELAVQLARQRVTVKHALDTGQHSEMAESLLNPTNHHRFFLRGVEHVELPRAMPHVPVNEEPGFSLIRASPVRNAFGGQVIGSTARLRRPMSGSGSKTHGLDKPTTRRMGKKYAWKMLNILDRLEIFTASGFASSLGDSWRLQDRSRDARSRRRSHVPD